MNDQLAIARARMAAAMGLIYHAKAELHDIATNSPRRTKTEDSIRSRKEAVVRGGDFKMDPPLLESDPTEELSISSSDIEVPTKASKRRGGMTGGNLNNIAVEVNSKSERKESKTDRRRPAPASPRPRKDRTKLATRKKGRKQVLLLGA
jgi:hypothetical protein